MYISALGIPLRKSHLYKLKFLYLFSISHDNFLCLLKRNIKNVPTFRIRVLKLSFLLKSIVRIGNRDQRTFRSTKKTFEWMNIKINHVKSNWLYNFKAKNSVPRFKKVLFLLNSKIHLWILFRSAFVYAHQPILFVLVIIIQFGVYFFLDLHKCFKPFFPIPLWNCESIQYKTQLNKEYVFVRSHAQYNKDLLISVLV